FTAPISLDGTTVTVGGQLASISYISPTQVNALLPFNVPAGAQQLIVTSSVGSSAAFQVTVAPTQPGLLALPQFVSGGKQYVVGLFLDGQTYVGPPGAFPGFPSRPARPGETIVLFGLGFGTVTPSIAAGQIVQQSNSTTAPVQMLFGST